MGFDLYKIQDFEHWTLFLHENQCYIGRTYLWAKRKGALDFLEMSLLERDEFFLVGKMIQNAIRDLFKPDHMNYASLGNVAHHLHVHMVPRYQTKRVFEGMEFIDERYGKNYAPYDKGYVTPPQILKELKKAILSNF